MNNLHNFLIDMTPRLYAVSTESSKVLALDFRVSAKELSSKKLFIFTLMVPVLAS
jgi:hypothetical protein